MFITKFKTRKILKIGTLCAFLFIITSFKAQAPGSYSTGLRFWIKANSGVYSDLGTTLCNNTDAVRQWNDLSGNSLHAIQNASGVRPNYLTSIFNGNPVVSYSGTKFLDVPGFSISGTGDYHCFLVLKMNSASAGGTTDGNGSFIIDRTSGTDNLFSLKVVASGGTNRFFYQKRNDAGANIGGATSNSVIDLTMGQIIGMSRIYNSSSNSLYSIYVNSDLESTQSNASETTTPPNMRIGRHATGASNGMDAYLSEIIVYNNVPSSTNIQKIESYLSIKYGISRYQNTLSDYLSSSGTIIYPATTTHSAYITTITGIGQDNGSGLTQTNSKNQSSNDFVRMENPSAIGDGDFLLWGSNNGTMITPNMTDIEGAYIVRRLSRVWRVAHTGNIGTVDVSVDLSTVPGPKVEGDLRLLIDRDGDGFFDNDVAPISGTLTGSTFSVSGITFQNGDYFTVGSRNSINTPLPIELTEFRSTCHENTIELNWATATERENAFFVVERSDDGENWLDLKHIKGAGNSSTPKKYSFTDGFKKNELRYYRLTQVDYNGNTETFKLLSTNCINKDDKMTVYPNPASNELYVEFNLSQNYGEGEIKLLNTLGKICLQEKVNLKKGNTTLKLPLNLDSGPYTLLLHSDLVSFPPQKVIVR